MLCMKDACCRSGLLLNVTEQAAKLVAGSSEGWIWTHIDDQV